MLFYFPQYVMHSAPGVMVPEFTSAFGLTASGVSALYDHTYSFAIVSGTCFDRFSAKYVEAFGRPLSMQEWAIPSPGPGQILVRTEACGVYHTDLHPGLHAAHRDPLVEPSLPSATGA